MGVKSMAEIALASTWMLLPAFVSAQPPLADRVVEPLGLDDARSSFIRVSASPAFGSL
jgi:hypothetical protein